MCRYDNGSRTVRRVWENMRVGQLRKQIPQDDDIAIQRLALVRYFASGIIAGGSGVTLTMLLAAITIQPQSYVALAVLNVLLLVGLLYWSNSALRFMGLPPSRRLIAFMLFAVAYQVWNGVIIHPAHAVHAFSNDWWGVIVHAVFSVVIGGSFRFMAELEMDDLQYALDHDLGVRQTPTVATEREQAGAVAADTGEAPSQHARGPFWRRRVRAAVAAALLGAAVGAMARSSRNLSRRRPQL